MADETMTTEPTDSPQTEQNSESVLGSGSVGENQNWRDSLPEELKNDPTLQNYKDVESLAKTVVHQQKMIGSRIPIPKTEEEKTELYSKLGRPEEPGKYEVAVPEDYQQFFREESMNEFRSVAHKIGLNNEQVQALMDFQINEINHEMQGADTQLNSQREEIEQNLKQEWGYDYDKNVKAAQRAVQVYGDAEVQELLNGELGNNPALIKMFARLGKEVTEDMAQNTQNNTLSVSPLDAKQEIANIMNNPKHPYFDGRHREHKDAVEKMRQLHEKAFGTS
jgi:hypothetical protein|tara:strand:- start:363 stop:1199 length:837 start_codon:yes stop_codon:yes gene_type:complete